MRTGIWLLYVSACAHAPAKPSAAPMYQKGCDGGDGEGCYQLARLYNHGTDLARDPGRVVVFLTRGCELGNGKACAVLGITYIKGEGVAVDAARGRALLSRSCDAKLADGCAAFAQV